MENENNNETKQKEKTNKTTFLSKINNLFERESSALPASILVSSLIISGTLVYTSNIKIKYGAQGVSAAESAQSKLEEKVIPNDGVVLPVVWGDTGTKLVDSGIIDTVKFESIYNQRGGFTEEYRKLLYDKNNGRLKITNENSGYILNLLWALGLANKNTILETGEMSDPQYGGAGRFASTGGWSIAKGDTMEHFSKHNILNLTPEQQALMEKVSKGVYRPCCGNSTHFPDCNHGMAMLALLELMASQGASEQDMWNAALVVNSYWFPNNYLTIATYMESKGINWKNVNPQEILGASYSSSQGFANIASQVTEPSTEQGGSGCGLGGGAPQQTAQPRQQGGCGI